MILREIWRESAMPATASGSASEVNQLRKIELHLLESHPQNPRRVERPDVVAAIANQIKASGEFDFSHAILVRPMNGRFQIVSGHHRVAAAKQAGLEQVPAWVRDLSDEEALMQLVLSNEQGQLYPLERGLHALTATGNGMTLKDYAAQIGQEYKAVAVWKEAADVAILSGQNWKDLARYTHH